MPEDAMLEKYADLLADKDQCLSIIEDTVRNMIAFFESMGKIEPAQLIKGDTIEDVNMWTRQKERRLKEYYEKGIVIYRRYSNIHLELAFERAYSFGIRNIGCHAMRKLDKIAFRKFLRRSLPAIELPDEDDDEEGVVEQVEEELQRVEEVEEEVQRIEQVEEEMQRVEEVEEEMQRVEEERMEERVEDEQMEFDEDHMAHDDGKRMSMNSSLLNSTISSIRSVRGLDPELTLYASWSKEQKIGFNAVKKHFSEAYKGAMLSKKVERAKHNRCSYVYVQFADTASAKKILQIGEVVCNGIRINVAPVRPRKSLQ